MADDPCALPGVPTSDDPAASPRPPATDEHGRKRLTCARRFSRTDQAGWDGVAWGERKVAVRRADGTPVSQPRTVVAPVDWSDDAVTVVAEKYLHGGAADGGGENSVRQMLSRVDGALRRWARQDGLFASDADADACVDEIMALHLQQRAAFNSPVWFNLGIPGSVDGSGDGVSASKLALDGDGPQCSACFINSVEDSMDSILELCKTEGKVFQYGSGAGTNLSPLRGSQEGVRGGGTASGPVSFMRGFDAFAGVIKSGGRTRRAAKIVILDIDHPDILAFVRCKWDEERKLAALVAAGLQADWEGAVHADALFQNANNSVRVTDAFMLAVQNDATFALHNRVDDTVAAEVKARELWQAIGEAAHGCGDPGLQFDTTINTWHTCKNSGRIEASNPCSEYMFLNDTACNLASLNLLAFLDADNRFDVDGFVHAVRVMLTAQELLVTHSGYPNERIGRNARAFRPLGLGYANLGALLMAWGLAYDSDEGRAVAGAITAIMGGEAYAHSARMAAAMGPFAAYEANRDSMLAVIAKHAERAGQLVPPATQPSLADAAQQAWQGAMETGRKWGFRNAQVTLLAPTGTIGLMMDCDTLGVEPELALVKTKQLVGGGVLVQQNRVLRRGLASLGYDAAAQERICTHVDAHGTLAEAPGFDGRAHGAVFACALPNGADAVGAVDAVVVAPAGHVAMVAAVQPFLSGAVSKTVNMPADTSVQAVLDIYMLAWQSGLKAISVYRDGSKHVQPVQVGAFGIEAR